MVILFYAKKSKSEISSFNVHINEVLDGLVKKNNTIIYANGQPHKLDKRPIQNKQKNQIINYKSILFKIKSRLWSIPEIELLWKFINEIIIFISAFFSVLRYQPDLIYRRHEIFNSEFILSKLFNKKCIKEVNGLIIDESKIRIKNRLIIKVVEKLEKMSIKKSDKFIVVTPRLKITLCNYYKVPESKITVIENGANTELFKPLKSTSDLKKTIAPSSYIVGYTGSFAYWHGLDDLIRSIPIVLKSIPNLKVILVGDGALRHSIYDLVCEYKMQDIFVFTGMVSYNRVPEYVNIFDICVIPKKKNILGAPLKLCEYMACGKPVIATKSEDFKILEECNGGVLINPENPQEFADSIICLLHDPVLRNEMGEKGRKFVVDNRSWFSVVQKVAKVCESSIANS